MNISELKSYKQIDGEAFSRLDELCNKTGNCAMNGYLASSLVDCSFDESGLLEFSSCRTVGDTTVDSIGCVLDNSILIKQVQKSPVSDYCKLYSWDVDEGVYTYLEFDEKDSLNRFYTTIKRFGMSLCEQDLSTALKEMGLNFDNVTQVLIKQEVDPISVMFDDAMEEESKNSLVL